jgi:hypothetical protein
MTLGRSEALGPDCRMRASRSTEGCYRLNGNLGGRPGTPL